MIKGSFLHSEGIITKDIEIGVITMTKDDFIKLVLNQYEENYTKYIKYWNNQNFYQRCIALADVLYLSGVGMDVIGDIEHNVKKGVNKFER